MREIRILAGGRGGGPEDALARTYLNRLPWKVSLIDVPAPRGGGREARLHRLARRFAAAIPEAAHLVALDEGGEEPDSREFADRLRDWLGRARTLVFLIGEADGLPPAILARADRRLALSRMTWPHLMVRAMLAEQLYRASTIIAGHPYHRV